jgi:Na+-driven multidrug efflux pump
MRSPMVISVSSAALVGAPLGWWLATQSGLGATGMWIANLVYAVLNAVLMIGWLLRGGWARRFAAAAAR